MKLAADFRQRAREALKGNWFIAVIAGFIASLLGGVTSTGASYSGSSSSEGGSSSGGTGTGGTADFEMALEEIFGDPEFVTMFLTIFGIAMVVASVFSIIYMIIGGAVGIGYSKFNLDLMDGNEARVGTLFDYFNEWKKGFVARLLRSIYIFLWSLLFVIPGIMASYSYALVHHVMAEDPSLTAREALRESKEIMRGNRWRLFCLLLSFIGWDILGALTLGIGYLWITPYREAAIAAFYRDITGTDNKDQII
ncbi:MAG: DUF975 family protein [Clostridia bacterium]|nr:DUF975 family protein [Clostridia bacterium]